MLYYRWTRKLVPLSGGKNDVQAQSYDCLRRRTRDTGVVTRHYNRFLGNSRSRRTRSKSTVKWDSRMNSAWDPLASSRQTLADTDRITKIILLTQMFYYLI